MLGVLGGVWLIVQLILAPQQRWVCMQGMPKRRQRVGKWLQERPRRPARIASVRGDMAMSINIRNGLLAVGTKTIATRGAWRILAHASFRSPFLLRLRRDCFIDLHEKHVC